MTHRLAFTIPGPPVPNERARKGKGGHWYTPARTREYRRRVAWEATKARLPTWPLHARYRVVVDVYFGDARRRDGDNVIKGIQDACIGVLWIDDAQIVESTARKHIDRDNPRAEVVVEVIEL